MEKEKKELLTASECILQNDLDWPVVSKSIMVDGKEVSDYQAIVRHDNGHIFQIAKNRYLPLQNRDAFNWFDEVVGTGQAKYDSAGSYRKGAIVFIQARLPYNFEVLKGDEIATYLRLTTSHDGSTPVEIAPYVERLVCTNGLTAMVADAKRTVSVKHTINSKHRFVFNAKRLLEREREYFQNFQRSLEEMAKKSMTALELDQFLSKLFNLKDEKDTEKNQTRIKNQIDEIKRLNTMGTGADIEGVQGTVWGAYNAVTEYIDNYQTVKGGSQESRDHSSLYGTGSRLRDKAYQLLTV